MLKRTLLLAALVASSVSANAALQTADWKNNGDGKITFDSATNLQWLDLTETAGLSFNATTLQLDIGGQFEGWRHATFDETVTLMSQFGFAPGSTGLADTPELHAALASMTAFLGDLCTTTAESNCANGWTQKADTGDIHQLGAYLEVFAIDAGKVGWTTVPSVISGADDANAWTGSFLVRAPEVPVPAAAWLFGSALLGFGGLARRRK